MRLHHVQVAIPVGGEPEARRFYVHGLGLTEVDKPVSLGARGGLWVRHAEGAEIHLGVEEPFRAARKAHPVLLLEDAAVLDATAARLAGLGNRVELLAL